MLCDVNAKLKVVDHALHNFVPVFSTDCHVSLHVRIVMAKNAKMQPSVPTSWIVRIAT